MTKPITVNITRPIARWAAKYRLRLGPDEALYTLVKTNIRKRENALNALYGTSVAELALYRTVATYLPSPDREDVAKTLRTAGDEIEREMDNARRRTSESLQKVETEYRQLIAGRYFLLGMWAALMVVLVGASLCKVLMTRWRP